MVAIVDVLFVLDGPRAEVGASQIANPHTMVAIVFAGKGIVGPVVRRIAARMARIGGSLWIDGAGIACVQGVNTIVGALIATIGFDQGENWSLTPIRRAPIRDRPGLDAFGAAWIAAFATFGVRQSRCL